MIRISVSTSGVAADIEVTEKETLTAGRVGLQCEFTFGSVWDGLQKIAVFEGAEIKEVALGLEPVVEVPWECLAIAGYRLRIGVTGISPTGETVIPTVWAKVGKIQDSADASTDVTPTATPSVVAQILQAANNAVDVASSVVERANSGEFNGKDGDPGEDGYSPEASVYEEDNEIVISITDKTGTTTERIHNWVNQITNLDGLIEALNYWLNDITPWAYRITIPRASIGNNATIMIGNTMIEGLTLVSSDYPDEQGNPGEGPGFAYLPFLKIGDYYYSPLSWSVKSEWIILKMATVPPPETDVTVYLVALPAGYHGNGSPIELNPEHTVLRFADPWTANTQGG